MNAGSNFIRLQGIFKILEDDYNEHYHSSEGFDRLVDEKIIKIVCLTRRFMENPPKIDHPIGDSVNDGQLSSRWKWFLLLLIPVGIWQVQVWFSPSNPPWRVTKNIFGLYAWN